MGLNGRRNLLKNVNCASMSQIYTQYDTNYFYSRSFFYWVCCQFFRGIINDYLLRSYLPHVQKIFTTNPLRHQKTFLVSSKYELKLLVDSDTSSKLSKSYVNTKIIDKNNLPNTFYSILFNKFSNINVTKMIFHRLKFNSLLIFTVIRPEIMFSKCLIKLS